MDPVDSVEQPFSRGTGLLGLAAAALLTLVAAPPAAAQVEEGISIGLTPTAEHVFWSDDLRLDDETYWGAEGSLNFGRFVSLQAHYLWGDDVDAAEVGPLETRRFGGDVVFTFAETSLTPFLKAGAGVAEFEAEGAEDEFLTGRIGGGIRFDIFERLQTQVFVQDLMVRAAPDATIVAPGQVDEDGVQTIHNLGIGAGVNFYLGGQRDLPATDRVFRGLQGFSVPVEFFAGSLVFDNALGLADETVAGARLGLDFGSYVGLRGYYFGSTEGDFDGFTDYFGYGAEGQFNLTRSDETISPFLTLGAGRLHFPDDLVEQAGLDDDKEWTASFGGGVAFNVTERLRAELGARDLVMTAGAPEDVTDPDQLQSNWLFTGGLKFAVGGETPDPRVRPEDGRPPFPRAEGEPDGEERMPGEVAGRDREMDRDPEMQDVEGEDELRREVLTLRQEMDALRMDLRLLAMGERAPMGRMDRMGPMARADTAGEVMARTQARDREVVEVPVLEEGEIYIRFGESGTFERMSTEQLALLRNLSRQEGERLGELRGEALPPAAAGGGAAPADRLERELERLRTEVEALREEEPAEAQAERPEADRPEAERPEAERPEAERREDETQLPRAEPPAAERMRMDSLLQAVRDVQAELDSLRDERERAGGAMERPPETRQRLPEVERLERRVRDLEAELERTRREDRPRREAEDPPAEPRPEAERAPAEPERERAPETDVEAEVEVEPETETEPDVEAEAEPAEERGVLEGGRARFRGISPYTGATLHEPNQLLLGVQADIGSAFGGPARLVPELNVGVTDEFTWNVNAHIEWPLPFDFEKAEPYVGTGLGLLEADGMEVLIPNVVAGASYPLGDYQVFGALHGLDFFDDTRLLFGLRTQPPAFLRSDGGR